MAPPSLRTPDYNQTSFVRSAERAPYGFIFLSRFLASCTDADWPDDNLIGRKT